MDSHRTDPFFMDIGENPFQDPSVIEATNNSTSVAEVSQNTPAVAVNNTNLTDPSTSQLPAYSRTGQQSVLNSSVDDLTLEEKVAKLEKEKEELKKKYEQLEREKAKTTVRPNNFPPLPEGFCVQPCFYIDIDVDINVNFQKIVRHLYHLWMLNGCFLVLNVLGNLALLVTHGEIVSFFVSIVYLFLFTPLSFLCWFRPVYRAFKEDSSFQFMVFFFVFFFQFLITTFMAIGLISSGSCGLTKAIYYFNEGGGKGIAIGIIVLIISLGFASCAAIELLLLTRMLVIYRGTEASIGKAANEFSSGIMNNRTVQNMASDVARSQFNQQFSNNSNSSNPSNSGNFYNR